MFFRTKGRHYCTRYRNNNGTIRGIIHLLATDLYLRTVIVIATCPLCLIMCLLLPLVCQMYVLAPTLPCTTGQYSIVGEQSLLIAGRLCYALAACVVCQSLICARSINMVLGPVVHFLISTSTLDAGVSSNRCCCIVFSLL